MFESTVCTASRHQRPVRICVVVLRSEASAEYGIVHLLHPLERRLLVDEISADPLDGHHDAIIGNRAARDTRKLSTLTKREREVLRLLAQGMSNLQIAAALFISPRTARNHVQHILGKLCVHSRLEAIVLLNHLSSDDGDRA